MQAKFEESGGEFTSKLKEIGNFNNNDLGYGFSIVFPSLFDYKIKHNSVKHNVLFSLLYRINAWPLIGIKIVPKCSMATRRVTYSINLCARA